MNTNQLTHEEVSDILDSKYWIEYYTRINGHMTRHLFECGNDFDDSILKTKELCKRSDISQVILNYIDSEIYNTENFRLA